MVQRISDRRRKKSFGAAFVELAVVLPGIFLLGLSLVEYGNFLLKRSVVSRTITAAADFVRTTTPNRKEESSGSVNNPVDINNVLKEASNGLIDQSAACGATTPESCSLGNFSLSRYTTKNPTNKPYSVFIKIELPYEPITGYRSILRTFLPEKISESMVVAVPVDAPKLPTPNCGIGEVLTFKAEENSFECELVFGGMFRTTPCDLNTLLYNQSSISCAFKNPVTKSCSCPKGFDAFPINEFDGPDPLCRCNTTRLPDGTFYCNSPTRCRATTINGKNWICPQHPSVEGGKGSILFQCVKSELVSK